MVFKKCALCVLLFAGALLTGGSVAQGVAEDEVVGLTGDTFVEALAVGLELDWNPCPADFERVIERSDTDVRCAVIGKGDPFREAERLGLMQARVGGKVLDVELHDGLPDHLFAGTRSLRPISVVGGYDRLVYLIDGQRVSMWVQRDMRPIVEGGKLERWMALRVNALDEPFPDYIPARWPPR